MTKVFIFEGVVVGWFPSRGYSATRLVKTGRTHSLFPYLSQLGNRVSPRRDPPNHNHFPAHLIISCGHALTTVLARIGSCQCSASDNHNFNNVPSLSTHWAKLWVTQSFVQVSSETQSVGRRVDNALKSMCSQPI